jgi:hypothetical protein
VNVAAGPHGGFQIAAAGDLSSMDQPRELVPPDRPILRYLATLTAGRDFGVSRRDAERIVRRLNPLVTPPEVLADALADALLRDGKRG